MDRTQEKALPGMFLSREGQNSGTIDYQQTNPVEFAARARQTPLGAGAERRSLPVCGFLDSLLGMKPSRR